MRKWVVLSLIVALLIYLGWGYASLASQQQTINGDVGKVWSAISTGTDKLHNLETQLKFATNAQQQALQQIAAARSSILALEQVHDLNALEKVYHSFAPSGQMGIAINAVREAYPDFGLAKGLDDLLVETAGTYDRIDYARTRLINDQVSFNQTRIWYPPLHQIFPVVTVIGSTSDPGQSIPGSTLGGSQPAPSPTR
jgi:hypothetical protein